MYIHPDGVIRVTNKATDNVLSSKSFFSSSYSTKIGGSIYVKGGSCIQYHVCSINSTNPDNTGNGCHSYVSTTNESYIIESSLSKSKGCYNCVCVYGGSQLIDSTNISYAKCVGNTAYACYGNPSSHLINFTSIIGNTADKQCVMFHGTKSQYVYCCNVINNTHNQKADNYGIVRNFDCYPLNISSCVFSSNSGPSLFSNNGEFVVDQCFLGNDNNVTNTASGNVNLNRKNDLVLSLSHFSTDKCDENYLLLLVMKKRTQDLNSMESLFSLFVVTNCSD